MSASSITKHEKKIVQNLAPKSELSGNLVADPRIFSGKYGEFAKFTIVSKDRENEKPSFKEVRTNAVNAKNFLKGDFVRVVGRELLVPKTNPQTGDTRNFIQFKADEVKLLSRRENQSQSKVLKLTTSGQPEMITGNKEATIKAPSTKQKKGPRM